MSRLAQALLAAAVAALILATGALPGTSESELETPLLVAPAQGASVIGGTPIVFQVRTFPDDRWLVLNVSRSATRSACGAIDDDVSMKYFSPTADSSLYQAAPTLTKGGWMETPGTYYWQAYRIAGDDGCVESELRSFTITPGPSLTPPQLLSPTPGQSIRVGTAVSFQIRTYSGDKSLSLRVSSSRELDSSGRLRGDVQSGSFAATSDPAVFEIKPTYYAGGWMDTPGTYYWQAYRTVYGSGADGSIESEVHSFTISDPPPKSLAAARLEGKFGMLLTVRSTSGARNLKRGQVYKVQWAFTPKCRKGSCRTTVDISALSGSLSSGMIDLKRKGAAYAKRKRAALFHCLTKPILGPLKINLRVKQGAWIEKEWMAAQISGRLKYTAAAMRYGNYRCHAGHLNASLQGWLLE